MTVHQVNGTAISAASTVIHGTYGDLTINPDGSYSYVASSAVAQALAEGAPATETFNYTVIDTQGGISNAATLTFHITGVNDEATLSSASIELTETDEQGDISTSGMLTITDVDSAETFVAQPDTDGVYGKFTIDAAGNWTYTANGAHDEFVAGEHYTEHFDVFSADGTATTVDIDILGTNDAPVAANDTGLAVERGGTANGTGGNNATGNVLSNDTDVDDQLASFNVTEVHTGSNEGIGNAGLLGTALAGAYGTLTLYENGDYTYVVNENDAAVQALNVGGSLTDTFNYTMSDGNLSDTAVLNITINGANDAPTDIRWTAASWTDGDDLPGIGQIASLSAADPDNSGPFTYSLVAGSDLGFTVSTTGLCSTRLARWRTVIHTR